jgi:hypothetical protein
VNLRIIANYPATDGSMPESVEVEWTDVPPDQDNHVIMVDSELMPLPLAVLDRLLTAAARTRTTDINHAHPAAGTPASKCDGDCSGNWIDLNCSWHGTPARLAAGTDEG